MAYPALQRVRQAVRAGAYVLTTHAEQDRETDGITTGEIEEALGSEDIELLEDYPDDPRGPSALSLGFDRSGHPLHALIGMSSHDVIFFITLYRPDSNLWYDWRRRV